MLGGVVGLLLVLVPFSPLLGGFTAGHLHRRKQPCADETQTRRRGIPESSGHRAGAASGVVVFVPVAVVWLYAFPIVVGFPGGPPPARDAAIVSIGGGLILALYTVVLGRVGGVLGEHV